MNATECYSIHNITSTCFSNVLKFFKNPRAISKSLKHPKQTNAHCLFMKQIGVGGYQAEVATIKTKKESKENGRKSIR